MSALTPEDLAELRAGLQCDTLLATKSVVRALLDQIDAQAARIAELERERYAAGGTLYAALRWAGMSASDLERAASYAKLTIERHEEEERSMRESIRAYTKERDALRADFDYASKIARSAFCAEQEVPDGLVPTFYHTGSAAGDRDITRRLDEARRRWAGEKK